MYIKNWKLFECFRMSLRSVSVNRFKISVCTSCGSDNKNSKKIMSKREDEYLTIFKCSFCDNVYLSEYESGFNESLYSYYNNSLNKAEDEVYGDLNTQRIVQLLNILKKETKGLRILDVGCGVGGIVKVANTLGWDALGIDVSKEAVEIAEKFNVNVKKIDFFSPKIQSKSKDVVIMSELIEHVPNPVDFLLRAEEILVPGGILYMTTPNWNSLDRKILKEKWNAIHSEHLTYFTVQTLSKMFDKHTNLECKNIKTSNMSVQLIQKIARLKQSEDKGSSVNNVARKHIEKSKLLKSFKSVVNYFLLLTNTGSSIVVIYKKPNKNI